MDLRSGIPFWLATNGILANYPALEKDLPNEEIVIIGSGISGALAAHELCKAGFHCTMLDKRMLSSGSTWVSTAQLNYEIDVSLTELSEKYNEDFATEAYKASLASVHKLQEVFQETGIDASVEQKSCLYLADNRKGAKSILEEYSLRMRKELPVRLLSREELIADYDIDRPNALIHDHAAQMDAYKATAGLINYHVQRGELTVFTHTTVTSLEAKEKGVTLRTEKGFTINARHVVCAPGYEAGIFIPQGLKYFLYSTYALVTPPVQEDFLWKDCCQIWETKRPYFYLRTTTDNRIIMGGEDSIFKSALIRDNLLATKTEKLLKSFAKMFPKIPKQEADFTWCGTFSFTPDGLPYIGEYPGIPNVYFALGYGGNGTTFSMIAAEIIANTLSGKKDARQALFSFDR